MLQKLPMRLECARQLGMRATAMLAVVMIVATIGSPAAAGREWLSGIKWPAPPVVDPGPVGGPPADAIVLFDGKDLSAWNGGQQWIVKDGIAIAHGSSISTKQSFGDCQLHVEWSAPTKIEGHGQGRGNSGIYLMGHYELQVLDSYHNPTYFDGQAGAIYKQAPPMVNVTRPPGQWNTYDIVFMAPKFRADGTVEKPAFITVLHNGVLIQNHFQIKGDTFWNEPPHYTMHPPRQPLQLQFHHDPVRFRNIWVREIKPLVGQRTRPPYYREK